MVVNCHKEFSFCQQTQLRGPVHVDVYFPSGQDPNTGQKVFMKEAYNNAPSDYGFESFMRVALGFSSVVWGTTSQQTFRKNYKEFKSCVMETTHRCKLDK